MGPWGPIPVSLGGVLPYLVEVPFLAFGRLKGGHRGFLVRGILGKSCPFWGGLAFLALLVFSGVWPLFGGGPPWPNFLGASMGVALIMCGNLVLFERFFGREGL